MGPMAVVGDRIQSLKKSSEGFFKAVLGMPSDSSRRSPLRDRQDKMERMFSFYKSCRGSPFDEVSTHIKGIVDLLNGLLFVDSSQQACDTLHKAGRRIGIDIRFIFETAVRQKDALIAELVTSPSNIGYLGDVLGTPLVLNKVKYTSNINDQLSVIAVPFGARTTDFEIGPGVPQGLPQFGPPLFSERQDCAGGLTFKGSNFAVSSAVLVSQLAPLTSSTADRCCWSTFAQLTYQTYKEMICAVSGIWQMPSRPGQPIKLGPFSIPIGYPKRSLALSDAQGWQPSSSSVTSQATDHHSASSHALMVELSFDESARLGAWIELQRSNPGSHQWGISLSDTPEDEIGWGLLVSRMLEAHSSKSHVEGFLNFRLGKKLTLQPGLLYLTDGNVQTPALLLRSNWVM
ncbi:uncharacterized protein LOC120275574 isoform X2 [Dioscorea cayenensis subsp. rotundata]|uniref:Uncharacterized protein LOC120275574 isoform X2 n=1 Tax=Dioscorea cayennensis subsp. rotundata TaxID=55577 RepID=A0AB40CDY0_DIOCR|nr:uncharacterized protein LOC120275574 isoform X2 [Dioscorea cayenensis subsp. rotundata]